MDYQKQANDFAAKYGVKLRILEEDWRCNDEWDNQYHSFFKCRLEREGRSFTFGFWQALAHPGKEPTMYDVLACLQKYDPGDFAEFCREYGYDSEPLSKYPRVMKIYKAVCREYRGMVRLFGENTDAMQELWEIA